MELSQFNSLSRFQRYMEVCVQDFFPEGFIPAGTYLFHGSRSGTILDSETVPEITYFGLEPSISVWKNIESLDEQVLLPEGGLDACDDLRVGDEVELRDEYQSYVYVFRTTQDIPFTYIHDIECHPENLGLQTVLLHPQIAYHGSPDCFLDPEDEKEQDEGPYKYNLTFEVTINDINLADNEYMTHVDTIIIDPQQTVEFYQLKFKPNHDSLRIIYDLFEHDEEEYDYTNPEINEELLLSGHIVDRLLEDGIDIYDDPDVRPDCNQYRTASLDLSLSLLNLDD